VNTRNYLYKFLTIFFGIPLAFLYGLLTAVFAFQMTWLLTPILQLLKIQIVSLKGFVVLALNTFMAPLYEIAALLFSKINITLTQRKDIYAVEQKKVANALNY
jgi:hypothetical protein